MWAKMEINKETFWRDEMKIFGFDFSIAKPAMCYYDTDTKEMKFYCWPMETDKKSEEMLSACDIVVRNRGLIPMSDKNFDGQAMVIENTRRASELSLMIANDVKDLIGETDMNDVYVVTEGLSYASKGNQTLDLSGYKYAMLIELHRLGIRNIATMSPVSIKHIAAVGIGKKLSYEKDFMISAIKETNPTAHKFIYTLINDEESLKKKTAFVKCVDDLVDSYWAVRSLCEKQLKLFELS